MRKLAPISGWAFALLCCTARSGPAWINASSGLSGALPGVSQLVIDRVTGTTFYALTSSGSIFTSTDSGSSWTALGSIAAVNAIALSPAASTVYAGTAHGVAKTTDGGRSWSQAGLSDVAINVLAIDPHTPSTLYASGSAGNVYRSVDGGAVWTSVSLGGVPNQSGTAIAFIAIDPLTTSTLYALSGGPFGTLYKSSDGGQSWTIIIPSNVYATVLVTDPSLPSTLFANLDGAGLSKSTDGGATWTATGLNAYPIALAIDPSNSNTLYASIASDTSQVILKSTDGGKTWVAVDTISAIVATDIPMTHSLVFGLNTSVYVTTASGIFKSVDGGMSWQASDTGLRVHDIRMLVGDPLDPAILYAGDNSALFQSSDGGASWTQLATFQIMAPSESTPFPPVAVSAELHSMLIDFTNPNILYLGTARPGGCYSGDVLLLKSTDGGVTWNNGMGSYSLAIGCDGAIDAMAMDPLDPNTLYLPFGDDCCFDFTILKTTDGGANWENPDTRGLEAANEVNALVIDANTPATMYVATDTGMFQSTDGGVSFLPAGFANTTVVLLAIDPVQPNVLYAATSSNFSTHAPGFLGLFKTTNSGASWSPMNQGLEDVVAAHAAVNALVVDAADTNVLYLATSGFGVFKSSDGGATWVPFNTGLTQLDVTSLTIVRRPSMSHRRERRGPLSLDMFYAGTPGGVFEFRQ
jgi:photosystem II stability/assembly factor-like uncharacterized protein